MKKFEEKTIDEKIETIQNELNLSNGLKQNEVLLIKLLIIFPLLAFVSLTLLLKLNLGFIEIIKSLIFAFLLIILGVYLYSRLNR